MSDPRWIDGPVLGLETTGRLTGAALLLRGRLQEEFAVDARASSQEVLGGRVDRLLRDHGLRVRDLARIGVALGPGSFTGVRVGLSLARGLALGAEVPLVGVSSHEALAWPARDWPGLLILLTGMRRGEVFVEAGAWRHDCWEPVLAGESRRTADAVSALHPLAARGPLLFLGEAVAAVWEVHPELAELGSPGADPLAAVRRPAVIGLLAARADAPLAEGEAADRLGPLYLRGADAKRPGERAAERVGGAGG